MKTELLHGTLEVLILKALSWGPMHGFGIGRWIEQLSGNDLHIEEGSLYPALYRIEKTPRNARRQGAFSIVTASGMILKRGHDLETVLRALEKKPKLVRG